MMDHVFSRPLVIALAILGALVSTLSTILQSKNMIGPRRAKQLNAAGYGCIGISMFLFIVAGFRT